MLIVYRHDLKSLPTTEHVLVCHLTTGMCVDQGGLDNMGLVQGKPNLSTGKIQSTCILEDSIPPLLSPPVASFSRPQSTAALCC